MNFTVLFPNNAHSQNNLTFERKVNVKEKGSKFTVNVTLSLGDLNGFARLQETLPEGFTAIEKNSKGGSFRLEDNKMKIIWMNTPSDEEFTVSYRLINSKGRSGEFTIDGLFSCAVGEELHKTEKSTTFTIEEGKSLASASNTKDNDDSKNNNSNEYDKTAMKEESSTSSNNNSSTTPENSKASDQDNKTDKESSSTPTENSSTSTETTESTS
ncbi:MAG: hypothetical protein ABEH43_02345, partial [Flavobacteriales bacterium]